MVTLMLIVTKVDSNTGLRENYAVFNGAEGAVNKLKELWPLLEGGCPLIEVFHINSAFNLLTMEEEKFVNDLVKELEKINA